MIHLRLINGNLHEARADIYSPDLEINPKAFMGCDKLVIYASEKSSAYKFANDHNIEFEPLIRA